MITNRQKDLRARLPVPGLISNSGLAPVKPAKPQAPVLRRTATYRAVVCALGLGAGVVQATDPIDLGALGAGGFRIDGIDAGDRSGRSVSGAGDVNGDGLDDVIVGAPYANPAGDTRAGESYVAEKTRTPTKILAERSFSQVVTSRNLPRARPVRREVARKALD